MNNIDSFCVYRLSNKFKELHEFNKTNNYVVTWIFSNQTDKSALCIYNNGDVLRYTDLHISSVRTSKWELHKFNISYSDLIVEFPELINV